MMHAEWKIFKIIIILFLIRSGVITQNRFPDINTLYLFAMWRETNPRAWFLVRWKMVRRVRREKYLNNRVYPYFFLSIIRSPCCALYSDTWVESDHRNELMRQTFILYCWRSRSLIAPQWFPPLRPAGSSSSESRRGVRIWYTHAIGSARDSMDIYVPICLRYYVYLLSRVCLSVWHKYIYRSKPFVRFKLVS